MAYLTVPEDLTAVADRVKQWFMDEGFNVHIEPVGKHFPYRPTFKCIRGSTTVIVDIFDRVPGKEQMREWEAFCKCQPKDVRYSICMPALRTIKIVDFLGFHQMGIGVAIVHVDKDYFVHEIHEPLDLQISIGIPDLTKYPPKVRSSLASAWHEINRDFLKGFDDACVRVEAEARRYLLRHVVGGRLNFASPSGKTISKSQDQILKLTMGGMADLFDQIVSPNHWDSNLGRLLRRLNKARIMVAHKRDEHQSISYVRRVALGLLWLIASGMESSQH